MFIVFLLFWILLNAKVNPEICWIGVGVAAFFYAFLCRFEGYGLRKDLRCIRRLPLGAAYLWSLVCEIIKANMSVMRLIYSQKLLPEPVLVHFSSGLKSNAARVLLANSITLTPGTITVSLQEDDFTVHCLDCEMADSLTDSVFVRLLKKMEAI